MCKALWRDKAGRGRGPGGQGVTWNSAREDPTEKGTPVEPRGREAGWLCLGEASRQAGQGA